MEVPPAVSHGEIINLEVNPPAIAPDPSCEVAAGSTASPDTPVNDNDMAIPEEGIYAPPRPRRVLHSVVVEFRTATLPRRRPRITGDDSFLAAIDDE
jgi:hypothetical protein